MQTFEVTTYCEVAFCIKQIDASTFYMIRVKFAEIC